MDTIAQFETKMNQMGEKKQPFLFLVDFEMNHPEIYPLHPHFDDNILYDIDGFSNTGNRTGNIITLKSRPVSFDKYEQAFRRVQYEEWQGNSYLTNLTFKTPIETSFSLKDIFYAAKAPYKLFFKDKFVVFSPEAFITIDNGLISTFPMKGTIDAAIPDARQTLLSDAKEMAEHFTIVDLLRNDLSMVSKQVRVKRFRYIDYLHTSGKDLLQASSEITGRLPADYRSQLGSILIRLLPAGSVSGAPKRETLRIIRETERANRGYYTGVAGIFDGKTLKSFVMIRFISKEHDQLYYHSGGGITVNSEVKKEYEELKDKIYVPSV